MQKNRINLFSEEFVPKFHLVTLRFALISWILVFGLVVLLWWHFQQQLNEQVAQGDKLQSDLDQHQMMLSEATEAMTSRQVDTALQQQLDQLQIDVDAKKRILNELAQRDQYKTGGYANLMLSLARHSQTDLWLTNIDIQTQGLLLEGVTLSSDAVPKWLKKLSNIPFFDGKGFADVKLYRDKKDRLSFLLSSQTGTQNQAAASTSSAPANPSSAQEQH